MKQKTVLTLILAVIAFACNMPMTLAQQCKEQRIRKEIRNLSPEETNAFLNALKKLHSKEKGPQKVSEYDKLAQLHIIAGNEGDIHGTDSFLPWHRLYLEKFESALRAIDSSVTVPYWDFSLDSQFPERSVVFRPDMFGGSGDPSTLCVTDGVAANWIMAYPTQHCLSRFWKNGNACSLYPPEVMDALPKDRSLSFSDFREKLENYHGPVHICVGGSDENGPVGDMADMQSPNDPIFWLLHAYIDKLWADYQQNVNKEYPHPNENLYHFNVAAGTVADLNSGEICISYEDSSVKKARIEFQEKACAPIASSSTSTSTSTSTETSLSKTTTSSDASALMLSKKSVNSSEKTSSLPSSISSFSIAAISSSIAKTKSKPSESNYSSSATATSSKKVAIAQKPSESVQKTTTTSTLSSIKTGHVQKPESASSIKTEITNSNKSTNTSMATSSTSSISSEGKPAAANSGSSIFDTQTSSRYSATTFASSASRKGYAGNDAKTNSLETTTSSKSTSISSSSTVTSSTDKKENNGYAAPKSKTSTSSAPALKTTTFASLSTEATDSKAKKGYDNEKTGGNPTSTSDKKGHATETNNNSFISSSTSRATGTTDKKEKETSTSLSKSNHDESSSSIVSSSKTIPSSSSSLANTFTGATTTETLSSKERKGYPAPSKKSISPSSSSSSSTKITSSSLKTSTSITSSTGTTNTATSSSLLSSSTVSSSSTSTTNTTTTTSTTTTGGLGRLPTGCHLKYKIPSNSTEMQIEFKEIFTTANISEFTPKQRKAKEERADGLMLTVPESVPDYWVKMNKLNPSKLRNDEEIAKKTIAVANYKISKHEYISIASTEFVIAFAKEHPKQAGNDTCAEPKNKVILDKVPEALPRMPMVGKLSESHYANASSTFDVTLPKDLGSLPECKAGQSPIQCVPAGLKSAASSSNKRLASIPWSLLIPFIVLLFI